MELEPQYHPKLEQTVVEIIKGADLDTATELSVRREAGKLLGLDLSDLPSKRLVRRIVESFLLSTSPIDQPPEQKDKAEQVLTDKLPVDDPNISSDDGGGRLICTLPGKRRVSVEKSGETKLVSIRDYYMKQGKMFTSTSGKGITLNPNEWSAFCSSFSDIEEAITKMESRMRDKCNGKKQTETGPSNPSIRSYESDTCHPLIPISPTRFTGKNYYCWKRQMEFFLNQLNIFYVLVTPCPKIPVPPQASSEEINISKSHVQKWINDDYICRNTILNSLSDQLFDQYSVKTLNAKELWDDLNSLYADDYGTKVSHVNNYIHFQMVDGVSVLEQVHELHRIAGIISTSGINIDERFHVGVIISKLPPSWKHIQAKLMQRENLMLDNLIYLLKDEEDSRSQQKSQNGIGKKDMRGVCFGCHQEGHIRRDCPLTRSGNRDRSNQ